MHGKVAGPLRGVHGDSRLHVQLADGAGGKKFALQLRIAVGTGRDETRDSIRSALLVRPLISRHELLPQLPASREERIFPGERDSWNRTCRQLIRLELNGTAR